MSGHSKWSTIKHRKALKDQKRGTLFSKLSGEIASAVREGGSEDPQQNPRLRTVLDKARAANLPSANISRAIARGLGKGSEGALEEVVYEGYGPAGIAILAVAHTDNRQRTAAIIKHLFEQIGGSLGGRGSAFVLFDRQDGTFAAKVRLPIHETANRENLTSLRRELRAQEDITDVYSNAQISDE